MLNYNLWTDKLLNLFGDGEHMINIVSNFFRIVKFLLGLAAVVTVTTLISQIIWIPFYGTFVGFASMLI